MFLAWSPDGNLVATGAKDDSVSIIDMRQNKIVHVSKYQQEVNEISWNKSGEFLFITLSNGKVEVIKTADFTQHKSILAHTAMIFCIEFDPTGRYFALGAGDALVSLWDAEELICVKTFSKLEWPVTAVSFSSGGQYIAAASEEGTIELTHVETSEQVHLINNSSAANSIAWHPKELYLAYACDESEGSRKDGATVKVFGLKDR